MLLLATEEANQKKQREEEAGPACAEPAAEEGSGELKIKGHSLCGCSLVCLKLTSLLLQEIFSLGEVLLKVLPLSRIV